MSKLNGKEKPDMGNNRKTSYTGNARFFELGSPGAPFRSLINADHLTNVRFEQRIENQQIPAQFDDDGTMTAPPQEGEPELVGWNILLLFGSDTQAIAFKDEQQAVECYNTILNMLQGIGCPMARVPKLEVMPPLPEESLIQGLDGAPIANDDVPDLTDEEKAQLADPEIIAGAFDDAFDDALDETEVEALAEEAADEAIAELEAGLEDELAKG
jgi:hypothetical protein